MIKFLDGTEDKGMKIRIEDNLNLKCTLSNGDLKVKVIVSYIIEKKQLELVSFRVFLKSFKKETVESLCKKIWVALNADVRELHVIVIGETENHPICQAEL